MSFIGELSNDRELLENRGEILIYGTGGYGEKTYRNLLYYKKGKNIVAFVDRNSFYHGKVLHDIPVISIEEALERHRDSIICIGGETKGNISRVELLEEMSNVHQITFNDNCSFLGTEYGGFYLPDGFRIKNAAVYSFGIGEDLSFSKAVIERGGTVYAFDPTPKSIEYVEHSGLFSHPNFHFFPYGLSDKDGKEVFYLPVRDDWVSASVISHKCVNTENAIEVEMKTLRTIMSELGHEHIDVLKMDIEGSEFKVIESIMKPDLVDVDVSLCAMELHGRFFASQEQEYVEKLYESMRRKGFYDFYGTDNEPTFIKVGKGGDLGGTDTGKKKKY